MNSVTFIIGQLILGGAEKQLYLLVRELHQRGWKVSVITLHGGHDDYWEGPIRELGVPLCEVTTTFRLRAIIKMIAFVKKHPTQIIHSWSSFTGLYAVVAAFFTGTPFCIGSQRSTEQYTVRTLGFILYWFSYCCFKGITVNSRFGLQELQKRWPRKEIRYIPNGLDFENITEVSKKSERKSLREQFGIPDAMQVVGAVGLMVQAKRFDLLIESVRIIQQNGMNYGLLIIGDGPLKLQLYTKAEKLLQKGTCFFPGFIRDAQKYMSMFDVFCLTSDYEGTPNVIMEALVGGLPVISTNVGDVSEIIENGVTGVILPSNNPEVIARSIQELLSNPEGAEKIAKAGKEKIVKEYASGKMADQMMDFYYEMQSRSNKKGSF